MQCSISPFLFVPLGFLIVAEKPHDIISYVESLGVKVDNYLTQKHEDSYSKDLTMESLTSIHQISFTQ